MGQHKHNLTAQLAKEGKTSPKPPKMGKREAERLVMNAVAQVLYRRLFSGVRVRV